MRSINFAKLSQMTSELFVELLLLFLELNDNKNIEIVACSILNLHKNGRVPVLTE